MHEHMNFLPELAGKYFSFTCVTKDMATGVFFQLQQGRHTLRMSDAVNEIDCEEDGRAAATREIQKCWL